MNYLESLVFIAWVNLLPRTLRGEFGAAMMHAESWIVCTVNNDRLRESFVRKMDEVVREVQ